MKGAAARGTDVSAEPRAALNRDSESFWEVLHQHASQRGDRKRHGTGKVTGVRLLKKTPRLQQTSQTICIGNNYCRVAKWFLT